MMTYYYIMGKNIPRKKMVKNMAKTIMGLNARQIIEQCNYDDELIISTSRKVFEFKRSECFIDNGIHLNDNEINPLMIEKIIRNGKLIYQI